MAETRTLEEELRCRRAALQSYMGDPSMYRPAGSDVHTLALLDKAADALTRLREENARLERYKVAHDVTSKRLNDAQAYAQKHCWPGAAGRNVWHVVLDDAIRLRTLTTEVEDG